MNEERKNKYGKYYIAAASIAVSLAFWLEVFGWPSIFSTMSCEGSLASGKATLCLLMEAMKNNFGELGLKLFFITGGLFTLYAAWHVLNMKVKK